MAKELIATHYFRQGKNFDDKIVYVYRDTTTGEKDFEIVDDPTIQFSITTGDNYLSHPVSYVPENKVEKVEVLNRNLIFDIAHMLGPEQVDFVNECMANGKMYYANRLHLDYNLHGSDVEVTDHYIDRFIEEHGQPKSIPTKGYFDIEVDIIDYDGFPDEHDAPAPINIVTYFHAPTMEFYTYALLDTENESLMTFVESQLEDTKTEIVNEIKEIHGATVTFAEVKFLDSELDLIKSFFNTINKLKPDFCGAKLNPGSTLKNSIN